MSQHKQLRTSILLGLCAVGLMGGYVQAVDLTDDQKSELVTQVLEKLKADKEIVAAKTKYIGIATAWMPTTDEEKGKVNAQLAGDEFWDYRYNEYKKYTNETGDGVEDGTKEDKTNIGSIAIGVNTVARRSLATAIGYNAYAAQGSSAVGAGSFARWESFAGGRNAFAEQRAVAIGQKARAGNETIAIGYQAEAGDFNDANDLTNNTYNQGTAGSTAVGWRAYSRGGVSLGAQAAAFTFGTAIGKDSTALQSGTALGENAQSLAEGGVALGNASLAGTPAGAIGYRPVAVKTDEELAQAIGVADRYQALQQTIAPLAEEHQQLENVAAKAQMMADWNAAQIRRLRPKEGKAGSDKYKKALAADAGLRQAQNDAWKALTDWQNAHGDYMAAKREQDTLLATWKGTTGAVSVGAEYTVKGKKHHLTRQITNLAAGTQDTDAVNVAQLTAVAEMPLHFYAGGKKAGNDYTVGTTQWTMSPSDFHLDFGEGLKAEQITKDGKTYTLVSVDKKGGTGDITVHAEKKNDADTNNKFIVTPDKPEMTVKGDGKNITATIEQDNTVKVALKDEIDVKTSIAVGGKTYIDKNGIHANNNKVTHVAAGELSATSTDAVNGAQLFATNETVAANTKRITNLNDTVNKLGGDIADVRNESREGNAMNAALAALKPLDFDPLQRSQVMAGISTYRGKQAVALGLAHYSNEDTLIHGGVSYAGHSELMANLGISWRFGDKEDRDNRKARAQRMPQYAAGPMSSVYVLQDEVTALKAKNDAAEARIAAQDRTIAEQSEQIEELQAQIRQIMARLG